MADYVINAQSVGYSIIGANAFRAYYESEAAGSLAISGTAATLKLGHPITAVAGSYVLTGTLVSISRLTADPAGYLVNGQPAELIISTGVIIAVSGTYGITGTAASLSRAKPYNIGIYAVSGVDTTLTSDATGRTLSAISGSYAITGPTIGLESTVTILSGEYLLTGLVTTLRKGKGLVALSRAFVISPPTTLLKHPKRITCENGSYGINTFYQTILSDSNNPARIVALDQGSYTLNGVAAILKGFITATSGVYTVTGTSTVAVIQNEGLYIYTGTAAQLLRLTIVNTPALYALSGTNANLVRSIQVLQAEQGIYLVAGLFTTVLPQRNLAGTALEGIYNYTGNNIILRIPRIISDAGAYAITGFATTSLKSTQPRRWKAQRTRTAGGTKMSTPTPRWDPQEPSI